MQPSATTAADVTALLIAESDRRLSAELFSSVFDNAPIGQALLAPTGRRLRVNRALCAIGGYSEAELLAGRFEEITHPDDVARDRDLASRALAGEFDSYQTEKRYRHRDGHTVWTKLSMSLVRDELGTPRYFIAQLEDITDAKRNEAALRERERELSEAHQLARLGTWEWDLAEPQARWSDETCRTFGRPAGFRPTYDEFIGAIHPDDRAALDARVSAVAPEDESDSECRIVRPDGELRHVHIRRFGRALPDGTVAVLYGTVQDVTDRRRVEQAVRDRERQLAEAQALAHFGSWEFDFAAQRYQYSDELCRIFGQPLGFAPTLAEGLALLHPDDREEVMRRVDAARTSAFTDNEYRVVRPDGDVRWVHTRRFGEIGPDGTLTRLWGTTQDVTEQKLADLAVRQARQHAETIVEAMSEGYALTVEGTITAVNDAMCELTGFTRGELVGAGTPFPFWPSDGHDATMAIRDRIVGQGGGTFDIELMRADGRKFDAEITCRPALNPDGSLIGFVNTIRDVSERRQHEAELERLASRDALTGLANHRIFHERLRDELALTRRHVRPLSVVLLDLDHFKRINDTHGHLAGDDALRTVGRRLAGMVREGELLARVGGEEFAWLLPGATGPGAVAAAERARRAIAATPCPGIGTVTLSAGVAAVDGRGSADDLYANADAALYRAKAEGRNRTVVFES